MGGKRKQENAGLPSRLQPTRIASEEQFWQEYVVPRQPALFSELCTDLEHLPGLWTDDYLINKAGEAALEVEQRGNAREGFGKGPDTKVPLSFREVLRRGAAGDASLYLTTQAVPTAPDGHPALYASPIAELAGDLPLVPAVMGRLVPQSINVWLGAAREGSSTGLHTDYHDNLYVLLRGRKRFRLYPPTASKQMYTVGKLSALHPNGRIVFKGQGNILPDGSEAGEVEQWRQRHKAEQELAEAEEAVASGLPGAAKRLKAAERRLDEALQAALDGDSWADLVDDFDALEAPPPPPPPAAGDPDSFSRIDLNLPDNQLRKKFPLFPGKAAALEVMVEAGQMLYLPAGWFHEVTSYSTDASPTHMALNFWYHPPDNLSSGAAAALQQPYKSAFWPALWEGRRAEYEAKHRQPQAGQQQQPQQAMQQPAQQQKQQQVKPLKRKQGAALQGQQAATEEGGGCDGGGSGMAAAPRRKLARRSATVAQATYGLFGVGRRQHLHEFVGIGRRRYSVHMPLFPTDLE